MAWNVLGVCDMMSWVEFLLHFYHLVEILLDLESCPVTVRIYLRYQPILSFPLWLKFISFFFSLFLYLSWIIYCKCRGNNKNWNTMLGIWLEEKLLESIVKNTVESGIVSSRRCPRVFLHIGLKFTSDREDFFAEFCIF